MDRRWERVRTSRPSTTSSRPAGRSRWSTRSSRSPKPQRRTGGSSAASSSARSSCGFRVNRAAPLGPCPRPAAARESFFVSSERRPLMPSYVVLINWTDQGAKTASETVDRYEAAKDDLAQRGMTIKDIYWTVGSYDIVVIAEAADDETASAAMLRLASQGNLRTSTLRAFNAQ